MASMTRALIHALAAGASAFAVVGSGAVLTAGQQTAAAPVFTAQQATAG